MLIAILIWAALSSSITAAACISIARYQRQTGLLANPKFYPDTPQPILSDPLTVEADEYLREGNSLNPPEFVPEGLHPTIAARQRTRIEGIRYTTRRVIKEVH